MDGTIMERAAAQLIRDACSRATEAEGVAALMEAYALLSECQRTILFAVLARQLVQNARQ